MKKIIFGLFTFIFLGIFSCKKSDSNPAPNNDTSNEVTTTVSAGTWRVTYYWDTDHEETINYAGYTFTFGAGKVLTAANGLFSLTGSWYSIFENPKVKLVLNFASPAIFVEISDDWEVIERTNTKIKLKDVSGGNGGTDYLTFEKN
jgi:hypothetical protein